MKDKKYILFIIFLMIDIIKLLGYKYSNGSP